MSNSEEKKVNVSFASMDKNSTILHHAEEIGRLRAKDEHFETRIEALQSQYRDLYNAQAKTRYFADGRWDGVRICLMMTAITVSLLAMLAVFDNFSHFKIWLASFFVG